MSKELVVSSNRHETRLAILEDDRLVEIYVERRANHAIAGSIYKGRVSRVLPGMQSAFVKLGLARDAFLYVSDVLDQTSELEEGNDPDLSAAPSRQSAGRGERGNRGGSGRRRNDRSSSRRRGGRRQDAEVVGEAPSNGAENSAEPEEASAAPGEDSEESRRSDGRRSSRRRGRRRRGRRSRDDDRERTPRDGESAPAARDAAPAEIEEPVESEAATEEVEHFAVLPGESLAKYWSNEDDSSDETEFEDEETEDVDVEGIEAEDEEAEFDEDEEAAVEEDESDDDDREETEESDEDDEEEEEDLDDDIEFDEDVDDENGEEVAEEDDQEKEFEADSDTDSEADEDGSDEEDEDTAGDDSDDEPEADDDQDAEDASDEGESDSGSEGLGGDSDEHAMPGEPQREESSDAPEAEASVRSSADSSGFQRRGRRGRRRRRGRGWREDEQQEATADDASRQQQKESREVEKTANAIPSDGLPNIKDLLKPGQELIVQIAKEPLGKKGARITSHVALPGRFMVYMPTVNHNGVSRKIHSDSERARLRRVVKEHAEGKPGGFIVRTAARGASDEELQADLEFLYQQWLGITEKAEKRNAPVLLYHDLDVVERVMRDQLGQNYKTIWVDGEEEYERVLRFVERFQPELLDRVKLYTRSTPIYDEFNISQEIERALRPKVWLKSGGYLVINQTEALVAIDVNTGKYVGKSDRLEDTILKTNMEAAEEVVRQMRLRDLGGIIIVDFIDMEDRKNRHDVHQTLENALRRDRAPSKALPFNDFGLIAITRKRVKQSLERALCSPCPTCAGSGSVKSVQTVVSEILNESRKVKVDSEDGRDVILRVHPEVAKVLKSRSNTYLQELEDAFKANVLVRGDVELHPEHYNFH